MKEQYNHVDIENKVRAEWEKSGLFQNEFFDENEAKTVTPENKKYVLPQWPYPSGSGLHMGHSETYVACDIYSRYLRMKGYKVLQALGWDSFGLPAENYAIKTNIHPRINTETAIDNFREQIKLLGVSVDWSREVASHKPDYYKWTQWLFLFLYEQGLAYRKEQKVNWCDSCKTVLANEQVIAGKCERCGSEVIQKNMNQWFFRITDYADRLYDDLDKVDWPEESVKRQRDWIGRKYGAVINYEVIGSENKIECFTTRPETNYGATFIALSPDHILVNKIVASEIVSESLTPPVLESIRHYIEVTSKKTERERITEGSKKTGVFSGLYALNPFSKKQMPIWISDYVLSNVGSGAVVGVPAHDVRDFEFARTFDLEVIRVIKDSVNGDKEILVENEVYEGQGEIINSGIINGKNSVEAKEIIIDYVEKEGLGKRAKFFKLRDWSISRQRFWGAPVPMVFDTEGEPHPVTKDDLPVLLPEDVDFIPTGRSPLTYSESFQNGVEEKYGKGWKREVDTLDTFMCSCWYFFRYIDPKNTEEFASQDNLDRWMPVDFYLGGREHVTGHLLYSRFITKALFDAGIVKYDEPFTVHKHQGTITGADGRKMSKRWGNAISPTDVVQEYGADTARTYLMFMGPLEDDKPWDTNGIKGVRRFYSKVWNLLLDESKTIVGESTPIMVKELNKLIKKSGEDIELSKFNTVVSEFMKFCNSWDKKENSLSIDDAITFLKLLAPFGPYISEELNNRLLERKNSFNENSSKVNQTTRSIHLESWPEYSEKYVIDDVVNVAVQINGKFKGLLENIGNDLSEADVLNLVIKKYNIDGTKILKTIYVPNKIINIITPK